MYTHIIKFMGQKSLDIITAYICFRRASMTRRPGDNTPEPPGGRAAERLREFIDQRFPGGVPLPEGANEHGRDANPETEQVESGQQTQVQLDRLEQTVHQLVETLQ